jgi:2-methylcitrate dehydratase
VDWREITDIEIGTYTFAYTEIGSEPEKWDPKTRETADHSMPYIFAKVLVDGAISVAAFEESAYRDPSIRPLMNKIRIHIDDEVNALYPSVVAMKVKATTKDGRTISIFPRDPLGHTNNPMKDQDVRDKFTRTVEPVYGKEKTALALELWWNIKNATRAETSERLALLDVK